MNYSADFRPTPLRTRFAGVADVDALTRMINAAFVVERPIFDGDRIDTKGVRAFLEKGKFLVLEDPTGLAGCVYAEPRGDRGYIGLLSVDPQRQGSGLGRKLMEEAEKFFREAGCIAADLRVVSAREPLPAFYRHLGYTETHREEMPPEARPKVPCDFIHMSRTLT
jgi:ribosomal protein S18 acetylase RimI-like enzyme